MIWIFLAIDIGCTEFRESREKQRRNLELIFHVKAGLVEMELYPLQGDYIDASLMARTIIEEFNELVLQRANVKVWIILSRSLTWSCGSMQLTNRFRMIDR